MPHCPAAPHRGGAPSSPLLERVSGKVPHCPTWVHICMYRRNTYRPPGLVGQWGAMPCSLTLERLRGCPTMVGHSGAGGAFLDPKDRCIDHNIEEETVMVKMEWNGIGME